MTPYTVGGRVQQCIVDGFYLIRQGEDRPPVAYVPDPELAERIVTALNSHQALVEALKAARVWAALQQATQEQP